MGRGMSPRMDDDGTRRPRGRATLGDLVAALDAAARLADELGHDPLVQRVVEAFRLMPLEDRETVAVVLEREVQARRLSLATEEATGQSMHPNPHARLYVRAHETPAPRNLLERDELMLAMLAGLRLTPILLVPDIHASWLDGTREALGHLEPGALAAATQLLREALALAEESAAGAATAGRTARAG
jgi:hypothetical protein